MKEDDLKVCWVDKENNRIVPLESTVDKVNHTVSAVTPHFSLYMLFGNMPANLSIVDMVFVMDQSQNMWTVDPKGYRANLPAKFINTMDTLTSGAGVRMGIVGFSDFASVIATPSAIKSELTPKLPSLTTTSGATNLADGIWVGRSLFEQFSGSDRKRIMVLMTDGKSNLGMSDDLIQQIILKLQNSDAASKNSMVINTVAVGSNSNSQLLQKIAELTGGAYFAVNITPDSSQQDIDTQVKAIYDKLVKELTMEEAAKIPDTFVEDPKKMFPEKYKGYDSEEARRLYTSTHANILTGNYVTQATDISIGSTGPDLVMERTYNSDDGAQQNGSSPTMLGNGWRCGFESSVKPITKTKVKASALNLRKEYGLNGQILAVLEWGVEVEKLSAQIFNKDNIDWYMVKVNDGTPDGIVGYVAKNYIGDVSAGAEITYGSGTKVSFYKDPSDSTGKYVIPYGIYDKLEDANGGYKLTRKDLTVYNYLGNGKLDSIVDRHGNKISVHYDGNGRISTVGNDSISLSLSFEYNTSGLLWKVKDPQLSREVTYNYDANRNLTSVIDPCGKAAVYNYYDRYDKTSNAFKGSRIRQIVDANGHQVIKNDYDSYGRLVRQYDGCSNVKYQIYKDVYRDASGNVVSAPNESTMGVPEMIRYFVDENGIESKISYNPVTGFPIQEMDAYGKTINHKNYIYEYGPGGSYDPESAKWFDITAIHAPINSTDTSAEYNEYLNAINKGNRHTKEEVKDKKGYTTTTIYDQYGNTKEIIDAKQNRILMDYDSGNNLKTYTDKRGKVTQYWYEDGIRLKTVTDAACNVTIYNYCPDGSTKIKGLVNTILESRKAKNGTVFKDFKTTTYKYDSTYNNRSEIIDTLGNSTKELYDAGGRLREVTDARSTTESAISFTTKYTYDNMNRLLTEEDPKGNISKIQYDNVGNKRFVTNKRNQTTEYQYNEKNQLVKVIDAKYNTVEYKYDPLGNKIQEKNGKGGITRYDYDAVNRLVRVTDPSGGATQYQYDVDDTGAVNKDGKNNVKVIDQLLRVSFTESDELYRKVKDRIQYKENGTTKEKVTWYTYDANGNLETVTDALGKVTKNEYDDLNRNTRTTDGYGLKDNNNNDISSFVTTEYDLYTDAQGRKLEKVTATDALTHSTVKEYNALGQLVKATDPLNKFSTYTYDAMGNKTSVTDARNNTTFYGYDSLNHLTCVTDPAITVTIDNGTAVVTRSAITCTQFQYDEEGNNTVKIDRRNKRTDYHYNELNQLDKVTEKLNNVDIITAIYGYGEDGNKTRVTDANNNTAYYVYNLKNQLVSEKDADGFTKYYRYDASGNKVYESSKKNQYVGTTFAYDDLNRLSSVKDAEGSITKYTYNILGNILTKKDLESRGFTCQYDDKMHRLLRKIDGSGKTEEFKEYDRAGNLKTKVDRNGVTITYIYDELSRVNKETAGTETRETYYDEVGNLKKTVDETGTTEYIYDNLNRLTQKTSPDIKTVSYGYDQEGNVTYVKDPAGNETMKQYDDLGRLWKVRTTDGMVGTYDYYENGNRKSLTLPGGTVTSYEYNSRNLLIKQTNTAKNVTDTYQYDYTPDGLQNSKTEAKGITSFEYDDVGRVTKITEPISQASRVTTYGYDRSGNRRTQTVNGGGTTSSINYYYNALNRLVQISETTNGTTKVTNYEYDFNGNQTKVTVGSAVSTYVYTKFNQMRTVTQSGSLVATYRYDALGMRTHNIGTSSTTLYYYDGQNVILESLPLSVKARNVYGINLLERYDYSSTPINMYYLYNGHGDVVKTVDGNGNTLNSYDYDIFGNITSSSEPKNNPYKYAGYCYDPETNYYYLNARYYDPKTARFTSEDTYSGEYTDPLSLNLYTYCQNDPIMFTDPTGHVRYYDQSGNTTFDTEWTTGYSSGDYVNLQTRRAEMYGAEHISPAVMYAAELKYAKDRTWFDFEAGFTMLIDSEKRNQGFATIDERGSTTDRMMSRVYTGTVIVSGAAAGAITAYAAPVIATSIAAASPTATFLFMNAEPIVYGASGAIDGAQGLQYHVKSGEYSQIPMDVGNMALGALMLKSVGSRYMAMNSIEGTSKVAAGPVNFVDSSDDYYINMSKRADVDPDGYFDVVAHGSTGKIEVQTKNGPVMVDHRAATRLIQQSPGYKAGQNIRLLSCDTGKLESGFAQNLANKLNVKVKAPTEWIWADDMGNKFVAAPKILKDGTYVPDYTKLGYMEEFSPWRGITTGNK